MCLPEEFIQDFMLEGKGVRLCFHLDKIEIQIPTCIFCKSTIVVKHLGEKYICEECFHKLKNDQNFS